MTKETTACVAIYARVSTERQREKHTIDSQLRMLPEFARQQGWEIVDTYIDDGYSAETVEGRPAFSRLLDDAARGRFSLLLTIDEDRLSRAKSDMTGAFIYDTLRDNAIRICLPTGAVIDLNNADDDFFAGIKREFAKYEKRKILARVSRGRREKWRQGRLALGSAPYGYRFDKKNGQFSIADDEAAVVRLMFGLALDHNCGLQGIANELNRRGIANPSTARGTRHRKKSSAWAKSSVAKILHYRYCGELVFNVRITKHLNGKNKILGLRPQAEWISIHVPQIIAPSVFQAVQLRLKQRKILADRNKQRPYLCGGMVICAQCGAHMSGECSHGRQQYYICYNRKKHHRTQSCSTPWMRTDALDQAIWAAIIRVISNPQVLADALATTAATPQSAVTPEILEKQFAALEQEEQRALRLFTKGTISERKLDTLLDAIRQEREGLEYQRKCEQEHQHAQEQAKRATTTLATFANKLHNLGFAQQRDLLKTFIDGTPGTGIFVDAGRNVTIIGTVPVPTNPGSVQNTSML
jgi:site-specific DNA recombinase